MNKLPMSDLVPIIQEVIDSDGEFRLYPKGTSMLPLIVQERDCVYLAKAHSVQKGDIVLYKRNSGQYVLHRIIKKVDDKCAMCGDNQFGLEKWIDISQIIAKVVKLNIDSNEFSIDNKRYKNYISTLKFLRLKKRLVYYYKRVFKLIPEETFEKKQK